MYLSANYGHPYLYCYTKYFEIFVKVAPCLAVYIWKSPVTFGTEIIFKLLACMHHESIGSFNNKSCTIGYISLLNGNWIAHKRAGFFNNFDLYGKLKRFRSIYFGFKSWFWYSACIEINPRLEEWICKFSRIPLLNWNWNCGRYILKSFLMCMKR